MGRTSKLKDLVFLQLSILVYSLSVIFMKFAATADFFTFRFFLFYAVSLVLLGVYAVVWQQMLRRFKLSFAYINRAVAMLWIVIAGAIVFDEPISIKHIISITLIIVGVALTVITDE